MADTTEYPYTTNLDIAFEPLQVIDEEEFSNSHQPWFNQTLCSVNDSVIRVGIVEGEYHWHKHDLEDEFFYVVEGHLSIDLEDQTIELDPRQAIVIPKGVMHRPRAPKRTVILMVETNTIVPTGT